MPAYSGLWDAVHGQSYVNMPKSDALPPHNRGIIRTFMQRPAMHGHVTALGRNAPATRAVVDSALGDISIPGSFDYATRTLNRDYTMSKVQPGYSGETRNRVANATEADMAHTYDTTINNGYAGDDANNGQTAVPLSEVISDGT